VTRSEESCNTYLSAAGYNTFLNISSAAAVLNGV